MKSIYKSNLCKERVMELYDRQISELDLKYNDIYLNTSFGETHLIETGNLKGVPLLVFHGGNATTAYNLKYCDFLLSDFHIYGVDTIGHPGKSAETSLNPKSYEYGEWASEVITGLGYDKIKCFGGSFGAGIIVKTMCVAPEKIENAVLLVPSAIKNAPAYKSMSMMFPMIMYLLTKQRKWFVKCILPMAITEENISNDILETAKCSIDNSNIKAGMPIDVEGEKLHKFTGPVYIMAAEYDCLFPGKGVIERASELLVNCKTHMLKKRGHINEITKEEKNSICHFLNTN